MSDDELSDKWWIGFCGMVDRPNALSLISSRYIVGGPHHRKSSTQREQDLNLRRTQSSDFVEWSCAVVKTFFRKFGMLYFLDFSILRFTLLPYYQRFIKTRTRCLKCRILYFFQVVGEPEHWCSLYDIGGIYRSIQQ